jgi:hypothetical protein
MKLVLLKKLHQSQQMKENMYIAPGTTPNNHTNNSSPGATNHSHHNNHQLPAHQQAAHNNQLHELQNLHKLHAAGLTISGVKGRSSPKLPSNASNLSITSASRDKDRDRDLGLNLAHLGIPGLFGNSHIPGLGNLSLPGLIPPAHSGGRHQNNSHKSSSAKVSTLLKGVSYKSMFYYIFIII